MSNASPMRDPNIVQDYASLGGDVRALRKSRGVTLKEMALQLGRSIGWLSQIERGQSEPSIADLRRIAQVFDVSVSFFFRNCDAPDDERGLVVRGENRMVIGSRESGLVEELLSPDIAGDFEMIRSVFEPDAKSELIDARPTQEGGYVIAGILRLWIDETCFDLKAGDSFQFSNASYRWHNNGEEPAQVIWIISPPVY